MVYCEDKDIFLLGSSGSVGIMPVAQDFTYEMHDDQIVGKEKIGMLIRNVNSIVCLQKRKKKRSKYQFIEKQ